MLDIWGKLEYVLRMYLLVALAAGLGYIAGSICEIFAPLGPVAYDLLGFNISWNYLVVPFSVLLALLHWSISLKNEIVDIPGGTNEKG